MNYIASVKYKFKEKTNGRKNKVKNKNPIAIFVKPLINFVQNKQTNTKENIEEEKDNLSGENSI